MMNHRRTYIKLLRPNIKLEGTLPIPLKVSNWHPIVEKKIRSTIKYFVPNLYIFLLLFVKYKTSQFVYRSIQINYMITIEMYVLDLNFNLDSIL